MTGSHLRLLARLDGRVVALGEAFGAYADPASEILPTRVVVAPDQRRSGVGTALVRRLSAWARAHRADPTLAVCIPERDVASVEYWIRREFSLIERYAITAVDLLDDPPVRAEPPADVDIVTLEERPDLLIAAWELEREVWADMPGQQRLSHQPFDAWAEAVTSGRRPAAALLLALGPSGTPLAICTTAISDVDDEQACNGFTGVARAERGRGIALALKSRQLEWCRAAGYRYVETANHGDNVAMLRINDQLGYRERPAQLILHGPPLPVSMR